jgi:hypothetical protein
MPIQKIEVSEYECARCGYKWINRVNGQDGPIPQKCAKCKRSGWNGGENDLITPTERGLRRQIKYFEMLYDNVSFYSSTEIDWPKGLCEKFLKINPRPTLEELNQVLYPPGGLWLTSQNQDTHRGYVPDQDRPGWNKYDREEYLKVLKQEAQWRIELMLQIMKSRGINDYDPAAVISQQHKEREEAKNQINKSHKQLLEEIKKRQGHQIDTK